MKKPKCILTPPRTALIIAAIVAILGGIAFAVLQSQQDTLTGNTIETATANLQISTNGTSYSDSHAGFDFNNVVPGGPAVPMNGYALYLKNQGGTPLALRLGIVSVPTNPNHVDLTKVSVLLTPLTTGADTQMFTLQSLITGSGNGGVVITGANLPIGVAQQFKLQIAMASDAVSGSVASLGNIDFSFSGLAQ